MISRKLFFGTVLAVGIGSSLAGPLGYQLHAQPIVSTQTTWDGVTGAPTLSRDFLSASVGQTFTTPNDAATLTGMSLFLGYSPLNFPFDQDLRFHGYLFGWNGTTLGDLLWKSAIQDGATEIDFMARAFDIGGVPLAAGGQYAVVLSTLEADPFDPNLAFITQFPAYQNVGIVDFDAYTGGALIQSYADNWEDLMSAPWLVNETADLAIELRFAPRPDVAVPEPPTFVLLASALILLGLFAARRASRRTSR